MGNLLQSKQYSPKVEKYHEQHVKKQKIPGRPPSSKTGNNILSTDRIIDGLDTHLTSLKDSVRSMKGQNPTEAREQLVKMMTQTGEDLHRLNLQIGAQEKREGKSTFYIQDDGNSENLVQTLVSQIDQLHREKENLSSMLEEEKDRAEKEEAKNTDLLLRLSKVAGQKLVENNPAIADLNDRNRPTKLGEIHSELYDNEWTDALDGLQSQGHDEKYAIATLFLTLVNVFDFCNIKAETMLQKTEDAVNFLFEDYKLMQETNFQKEARFMTMPRRRVSVLKVPHEVNLQTDIVLLERWRLTSKKRSMSSSTRRMVEKSDAVTNHIKVLRKETAESMVPVVQKAYIKASWRAGEFVPALKPYIRKCIFLCWMMAVQSPPMCFHMVDVIKDVKFDKNMYKEYTISGPTINYVVWPALLLHEKGPLVGKGIAQGYKHRDNSSQ